MDGRRLVFLLPYISIRSFRLNAMAQFITSNAPIGTASQGMIIVEQTTCTRAKCCPSGCSVGCPRSNCRMRVNVDGAVLAPTSGLLALDPKATVQLMFQTNASIAVSQAYAEAFKQRYGLEWSEMNGQITSDSLARLFLADMQTHSESASVVTPSITTITLPLDIAEVRKAWLTITRECNGRAESIIGTTGSYVAADASATA
jgi:hypothetical protein